MSQKEISHQAKLKREQKKLAYAQKLKEKFLIVDKHVTYQDRRINITKHSLVKIIEDANLKWGLQIALEGSKLTTTEFK